MTFRQSIIAAIAILALLGASIATKGRYQIAVEGAVLYRLDGLTGTVIACPAPTSAQYLRHFDTDQKSDCKKLL